ncbi:hypothetical protein EVAR_47742_1 [Eumeta japonica]|uniref:Uncharacterized protein n=1 Tax=Eumeta variegata TaxID=151549 RepID=A0A4C1VX78_EUMVA|nr:hypothetical protein EVAR_47742_1 [Eumeta japonica]
MNVRVQDSVSAGLSAGCKTEKGGATVAPYFMYDRPSNDPLVTSAQTNGKASYLNTYRDNSCLSKGCIAKASAAFHTESGKSKTDFLIENQNLLKIFPNGK